MNNRAKTETEEEVFVDAEEEEGNRGEARHREQSSGVTTPPPTLRRSARGSRKKKSIDEPDQCTSTSKVIGKRHRPLGNMVGVQRSPQTSQPATTAQTGSRKKPSRANKSPGKRNTDGMVVSTPSSQS